VIIVVAVLLFGSKLSGQINESIEIIPYRLVPSYDVHCQISVELIEPATFLAIPNVYKDEICEILIDRVVFEKTNPFAINEPFCIDEKTYQLVELPNTSDKWYDGPWNHNK